MADIWPHGARATRALWGGWVAMTRPDPARFYFWLGAEADAL
jgi:hypothetical protein